MIVAVSLVRDSLANLTRFVEGNLGHGVDHLIVVTDGPPGAEVHAYLENHPRVTLVVADDAWWGGDVMAALNARQRVAANLVRVACSNVGYVEWLFFIDGDEVALLDRDVLAALPPEQRVVRLAPLESVASDSSRTVHFKRLLPKDELVRLRDAGLVEHATNASWFHGHVSGKVGIRPALDLRLRLHAAEDESGEKVTAFEHPALRHLHFESPTYAEFVRKWRALASSGPAPGMRKARGELLAVFEELASEPDGRVREERQRALYERFVAEDLDALEAMGVLEEIDVSVPTAQPRVVQPEHVRALEAELDRLASLPKSEFTRQGSTAQSP